MTLYKHAVLPSVLNAVVTDNIPAHPVMAAAEDLVVVAPSNLSLVAAVTCITDRVVQIVMIQVLYSVPHVAKGGWLIVIVAKNKANY